MMNLKSKTINKEKIRFTTTRAFMAMVIATSIIGIMTLNMLSQNVEGKPASCESKLWSHCLGTPGYYTTNGHHHCFKGIDKHCAQTNGGYN